LLRSAALSGWRYSDGSSGPPGGGRFISETYPYATLVGAAELGYDTERPRYKRKPPRRPAAQWRTERAVNWPRRLTFTSRRANPADPGLNAPPAAGAGLSTGAFHGTGSTGQVSAGNLDSLGTRGSLLSLLACAAACGHHGRPEVAPPSVGEPADK